MNTETVIQETKEEKKLKDHLLFTHMEDPTKKYDTSKANTKCKKCYGTGIAGYMHLTGVRLVCCCVIKATYSSVEMLKKVSIR